MKPISYIRHCIVTALPAVMIPLVTSCEHKPLWMPESPLDDTEVAYDWSAAPDADPEGMTLSLYTPSSNEKPWLYNLKPTGGVIDVPEGTYRAISYNNDTDGILLRNTDSYEKTEIYTRNGELLDGLGEAYYGTLPSRSVDEPVVITPDMIWSCASTVTTGDKKIILAPRQLTPRYSFTATEVSNLAGASKMCASISGLSGGIYLNSGESSVYPVTMPAAAKADGDSRINGGMITFGIPRAPSSRNILSLYIWLKDGTKHNFNFDVTEQVRQAADPMNVTVQISGISLPEITPSPDTPGTGGGIGVDVDTWHTVDIELKPIV